MKHSLSLRLLVAVSIVLAAFLGLAGMVLERAFRDGAERAMQERLQVYVYALLSAADISADGGLRMPRALPEARFSTPGSGLYGFIFDAKGELLWRSASSLGIDLQPQAALQQGEPAFQRLDRGKDYYALYQSVVWETEQGPDKKIILAVAENAEALLHHVVGFRNTLWFWLGGIGFFLIIAQAGILRWSLSPLRTIAKDLEAIEAGQKSRLDDRYPQELQGLASNLNALLDSERAHLERHRNTLADLAHSLKTPLAILRGYWADERLPADMKQTLQEQVARMNELVEYQLQRAAARGQHTFSRTVAVLPVIHKIVASLDKVYRAKEVKCAVRGQPAGQFFCEEGDLYEIVGNLLDNAYKWCASQVDVNAELIREEGKRRPSLKLVIEDDGPGIPEQKLKEVIRRGIRADEKTHGYGIGLAVVNELVRLSRGKLHYATSRYGGTLWEVWLPSPI